MVIIVDIPGKFLGYLDGTSMMQQPDTPLDAECRDAICRGTNRRSGRGIRRRVIFDRNEVAGVLADYADICIVANSDDGDPAEARAARIVLDRLAVFGVRPV